MLRRVGMLTVAGALAFLPGAGRPAVAMQFREVMVGQDTAVIGGLGEIVPGDTARLRAALANARRHYRMLAIAIDSPGGLIVEGVRLAQFVHSEDLPVFVSSQSMCASACFLVFAAAPRRFAGATALIGVHSANEGGTETEGSLAVTTQMARAAADLGVPPAIIGKMVETRPGRMSWLTRADLVTLGVTLIDDVGDIPDGADVPAKPAELAPAPPPPVSLPIPARPAPATPPIVTTAEFRGAYFCATGPAALSLALLDSPEPPQRRAVVSFGPMPTNPAALRGSFIVEGQFDLAAGKLDLHPASWLSQPPGAVMIGLVGQSDDSGGSFYGHTTGAAPCNLFTLRRTR